MTFNYLNYSKLVFNEEGNKCANDKQNRAQMKEWKLAKCIL